MYNIRSYIPSLPGLYPVYKPMHFGMDIEYTGLAFKDLLGEKKLYCFTTTDDCDPLTGQQFHDGENSLDGPFNVNSVEVEGGINFFDETLLDLMFHKLIFELKILSLKYIRTVFIPNDASVCIVNYRNYVTYKTSKLELAPRQRIGVFRDARKIAGAGRSMIIVPSEVGDILLIPLLACILINNPICTVIGICTGCMIWYSSNFYHYPDPWINLEPAKPRPQCPGCSGCIHCIRTGEDL
jgi:hypothetical protein